MRLGKAPGERNTLAGMMETVRYGYKKVQETAREGVQKIMDFGKDTVELAKHTVAASVMASAALVGCGGGGADGAPGSGDTNVVNPAPRTPISYVINPVFGGGVVTVTFPLSSNTLQIPLSADQMKQVAITANSSTPAVLPSVTLSPDGTQWVLSIVVDETIGFKGDVVITIQIGGQTYLVTFPLNTLDLKVPNTPVNITIGDLRSVPLTLTPANIRQMASGGNINSIELIDNPTYVSDQTNPSIRLGEVTQDDKGNYVVKPYPSATGHGIFSVRVKGPKDTNGNSQAAILNIDVGQVTPDISSIDVTPVTGGLSKGNKVATVRPVAYGSSFGLGTVPYTQIQIVDGANAGQFVIAPNAVTGDEVQNAIDGNQPDTSYYLNVRVVAVDTKTGEVKMILNPETGKNEPYVLKPSLPITLRITDPNPAPTNPGGGGTVCPPGTVYDPDTGFCG